MNTVYKDNPRLKFESFFGAEIGLLFDYNLVNMENIDICVSSAEFIAVRQTLEELCEKVCPRTNLDAVPAGLVGINHENLNVPKVMCGAVETMALLTPNGENGCSVGVLSNSIHGAVKGNIECDLSVASPQKPMVEPISGRKGCTEEPSSNSADGVSEHGMKYMSVAGTIKPVEVPMSGGNAAAEMLVNSTDGTSKHGMEFDGTSTSTSFLKPPLGDKCFSEEPLNNFAQGTNKYGIEYGSTLNTTNALKAVVLMPGGKGCSEEPLHNSVDDVGKHGMECAGTSHTTNALNEIISHQDNLEESGGKLNVSEEGIPVASDNIVSELSVCEHGSEHKSSSTPSCSTNVQSNVIEFPKQTANACNQVTQVQIPCGSDVKNNENVRDTRMSRQKRKKKNNKSNVQIPRSTSYTHGRNVEVNEFEFVLKVVQQDLEEIRMSSQATALAASLREDKNKNRTEDESESSDTTSSSSSSDSTSSESDSESVAEILIDDDMDSVRVPNDPPKTRDEVLFSDLPPPPEVEVLANKSQIKPIGEIESIIHADAMVIIKSFPDMPALDSDSILFMDDGRGFGQVFEIFGQVTSPHYCVRFNSQEEIKGKNLSIGQTVFYAPDTESMTNFVFVSKLRSIKGSDASWKHDQEPPQEIKEYSDDEAESAAKATKKKANKLQKNRNQTQTQQKDTWENAKKPRPPNPTTNSPRPPWKRQTTQVHQPRHSYQPPPRPFNVRCHPAEFYGERFPQRQNSPMLFNPRPPPPGFGPPSMQRLPPGTFYNHPQRYQGYDAPVPHLQQPQAPPYFMDPHHHIPPGMHAMFPPANGQQRHIPPPPNVGQPLDQLWTSRVNVPQNGQPVDLGQFPRPRWSTVQQPLPPGHYSPR